MSGIAGIYRLDGRPADRANAERMEKSIAHRGPDGTGVWDQGPVALAHRMLWATPESFHEKLPLTNKTGNLVLTADARIDNRDELIAALGLNGRPQNEITDSELILAAYEEWHEHCPEKLLGDFAFAIWDGRRQILFCARDHFGVKPFYYYHRSGQAFIFASEIKALLCLPEVPRRLNETRVADYLVPILDDKEITFYQYILRLPPAHAMTVSREGLSLRSYWALDPSRELRLGSDEEYAETFRKVFTDAVRCRLRGPFPIGSMLSGGLDSSSIVCVARELLVNNDKQLLHTFSAVFDDVPQCDERSFINTVLAKHGLMPNFVRADQLGPLDDSDRLSYQQEEASFFPNLYIHWSLYTAARQQNVRILLDGIDGDTTVSHGLAHVTQLARAGRWITMASEVRGISRHFCVPLHETLWRFGVAPLAPEPVRRFWRRLRGRDGEQWNADKIISQDFAHRVGIGERVSALQGNSPRTVRTEREDHWGRLTRGVLSLAMEVADRAAGTFTLEPRYPFFDKRLAEFCLALPGEQKLHRGWSRMVMRRAMTRILPVEIQWRGGKSNLSANFVRGLLTFNRQLLEEVIIKGSKDLEPYVDIDTLRTVHQRYVRHHSNEDALALWRAASLALWLRQAWSQAA